MQQQKFYGKYRGIVTDNRDPLGILRIRARVPDVTGDGECGWALPNVPFAGNGMGFVALPDVGARVWIEFEQGEPDFPIWTGCWWGSKSELPAEAAAVPDGRVVIKTKRGQKIILDDGPDTPNTITIQTSEGQKIVMNTQGIAISISAGAKIEINAAKITIDDGGGATVVLNGPQVSVNNGALEVI